MSESLPPRDELGQRHFSKEDRRSLVGALIGSIVRIVVGLFLILLMMILVPDNPDGSLVLAVLVAIGGIAIYVWFFNRQLKGVYRAKYPTLRASEALILVAVMFLAIFAVIYVLISEGNPESFTEPLDRFTAYYFALTVLATVGFGDITPVTTLARAVTMIQMSLDLAFIAVLVKVMGGAAKSALGKRKQPPSEQ